MDHNATQHCIVVAITKAEMSHLHWSLAVTVFPIFEGSAIKSRLAVLCFALNHLKDGVFKRLPLERPVLCDGLDEIFCWEDSLFPVAIFFISPFV